MMGEDQDWSFSRDAARVSINVFIKDKVSPDNDSFLREIFHDVEEFFLFFSGPFFLPVRFSSRDCNIAPQE